MHVITRMDLGGAQGNTLHTCRALDPERFEAVLVTGPGGALDPELSAGGPGGAGAPRVVLIPELVREVRPVLDLLAFFRLWSLFLAEKPDVVHTHSSKAGILGRLAARLAGVPGVVHTYHGFGFHDWQPPLARAAYVWAERLACLAANRLVFVSLSNRATARRHRLPGERRGALIRSGIPLARYPAPLADPGAKKASLGAGRHSLLVTSIGNLKPQKNPMDFVVVAHEVLARVPQASFLFVGDGPLRPRVECQVLASGLHGKLLLPGWRRDTDEILAATDVFVLTSLWEGLPRSLLEAMRTGLACVCYATDGVSDILRDGDNGLSVPIGNVDLLVERVAAVLTDAGLRRRLGARARESVGPEFDIDLMVRRQEELYGELLSPRAK